MIVSCGPMSDDVCSLQNMGQLARWRSHGNSSYQFLSHSRRFHVVFEKKKVINMYHSRSEKSFPAVVFPSLCKCHCLSHIFWLMSSRISVLSFWRHPQFYEEKQRVFGGSPSHLSPSQSSQSSQSSQLATQKVAGPRYNHGNPRCSPPEKKREKRCCLPKKIQQNMLSGPSMP